MRGDGFRIELGLGVEDKCIVFWKIFIRGRDRYSWVLGGFVKISFFRNFICLILRC